MVSVSSKDSSKYAPDWSSKKVTIFNGDANETVSCNLLDQTKCYGITVKGSAEEKAEYKKTMIPYIIGAILVFAASAIASIVMGISKNIKAE